MSRILFTLAEDAPSTTASHFAVKYSVDENDCLDFAHALEQLGHQVFFVNWRDLHGGVFERVFSANEQRFVQPLACDQFDLAFVYKMEGFLYDIPNFLSMVALFEKHCPLVINHPKTIRHNIDKSYLWDLQREGVRIIPTFPIDDVFLSKLGGGDKFVLKPRCSERGNGIFAAQQVIDLNELRGQEQNYIAQDYMPEIRQGERSLAYMGHNYQHAVLKKPAAANPLEFRCNESLGGTVEIYQPTAAELDFAADVLEVYEKRLGCPVHFSRIDLIDVDGSPMLMEAELLNPSMYANYANRGRQFGEQLASHFDNLLATGKVLRAKC